MTDVSGPWDPDYDGNGDPIPGTGVWSQDDWYRHAPVWAPSGVIGSAIAASSSTGDLALSVNGLTVTVGSGRAWVRGAGFERTDPPDPITVSANTNASLSRRDRIVLRRDLAEKTVTMLRLQGTPSATPAAPAISQVEDGAYDLPLFNFLVPPNSGTVLSSIVDERLWVSDDGSGLITPELPARVWTFQRVSGNSSDTFTVASGMTNLIAGTISDAPAGDYWISDVLGLSAAGTTSGVHRLTVGGTNVTEDMHESLTTATRGVGFSTTYHHAGGDLTITAAFQVGEQAGIIQTAGSRINAAYVGPL